eukprot:611772-Karenia_brevis.AAC.1
MPADRRTDRQTDRLLTTAGARAGPRPTTPCRTSSELRGTSVLYTTEPSMPAVTAQPHPQVMMAALKLIASSSKCSPHCPPVHARRNSCAEAEHIGLPMHTAVANLYPHANMVVLKLITSSLNAHDPCQLTH